MFLIFSVYGRRRLLIERCGAGFLIVALLLGGAIPRAFGEDGNGEAVEEVATDASVVASEGEAENLVGADGEDAIDQASEPGVEDEEAVVEDLEDVVLVAPETEESLIQDDSATSSVEETDSENAHAAMQADVLPDASVVPIAEEESNTAQTSESESPEDHTATTSSSEAESATTAEARAENEASGIDGDLGTDGQNGETDGRGEGSTTIATGNASSVANIVNVVNTTIFNSNGALVFLSNFLDQLGVGIDLRDLFGGAFRGVHETETTACELSSCTDPTVVLNVSATSTARIVNELVVRSMTGDNFATSSGGSASIETGDAYAVANVVNVANTNIVDSNYLLVSLSNFGDLAGDIVLPGKAFFEELFFANEESSVAGTADSTVITNNQADIETDLDLDAGTGNNSASSTASSTVTTGDASTHGDVVNHINQNLVNTNSLVLLFRIYGNWQGSVLNAPTEIRWRETPTGVELWHDASSISERASETDPLQSTDAHTNVSLGAETTNTASISNNVQVVALTGDNRADGTDGAHITTGNAFASASVVNIANTNIFGTNFIFAIFNIFGDWTGDISFGRPDLWIGSRIATKRNPVEEGDEITYHFTVANRGDADATNVRVQTSFPEKLLKFVSGGINETSASWDIGTVPAGEVVEFSHNATVGSLRYGDTIIENAVTVTSEETDANTEDNTEQITVGGYKEPPVTSSGTRITYLPDPDILVTKTNSATGTITASSTVDYTVTIENVGKGPAFHAVLHDHIKSQDGKIIHEDKWPLDTIAPGEEITITYTVEYNGATEPGTYVNDAQVKAIGRHPSLNPFYGSVADSSVASSAVQIVELVEEEDAGGLAVAGLSLQDESQTSTTSVSVDNGNEDGLETEGTGGMGPEIERNDAGSNTFLGDVGAVAMQTREVKAQAEEEVTEGAVSSLTNEQGSEGAMPVTPIVPTVDRVRSDSLGANAIASLAEDTSLWIVGSAIAILLFFMVYRRFRFFR